MVKPSILSTKRRQKRLTHELCANRNRYYKLAYSWTGDSMLADDLVQEAMQKAFLSFQSLQDEAKLHAWTCRILVNCHRDWLRRQKDIVDIDDYEIPDSDDELSTPYQNRSADETSRMVRSCIAKLNEKHRKVLTLVDLMEFSYEEVAQSLDIPIGTVMSRLCRARGQLKSLIEKYNPEQLQSASQGNVTRFRSIR